MRKLYIAIPFIVVVLSVVSYLLFQNVTVFWVVFFASLGGGVYAIRLAKKSFKETKGMEDY